MGLSGQTRVVSALGIVQIFAWGSTFYLLAVLSGAIAADTGWSAGTITAGVSLALLVSALSVRRVGRTIQGSGGRRVMSGGIALIALGLAIMGLAPSVAVYLLAWVVMGAGMAAALYDAAFATLGRIWGRNARTAITALTLWGGFASTLCWPLSAFLLETFGWRATCLAYALLHLVLTLPLCRFALPDGVATNAPPTPDEVERSAVGRFDLRFWCIAVAGTCLAMLFSILSIHLITILVAEGMSLAGAVGLGALIGPAQVGARLLDYVGGGRHHPVFTMLAAVALVLAGLLMLSLGIAHAPALMAYGAGYGLWSIARGALPLAMFRPAEYAVMVGRLATPMLLASAVAPMIGAALLESHGPGVTLRVLCLVATIPCVAAAILLVRVRRG